MTKLRIKQLVARSLMQRPELLTLASSDSRFAILDDAFSIVHQDIQIRVDLRCMEKTSSAFDYTTADTDGVAAPEDFKKGRYIWYLDDDGAKQGPYMADTDDGAQRAWSHDDLKLKEIRTQNGVDLGLSVAQRWYEKNQRIFLMSAPSETIQLVLDYYAYLAEPDGDSASNALTAVHFNMIAYGMAAEAFGMLGDETREAIYRAKYEKALAEAAVADSEAKKGGTDEVYVPPSPWERMR